MPTHEHQKSIESYAGIFLISAATLLLQVTFTRIFSVSIWYHFAFLVVSVALFGFGASGVALSLLPRALDATWRARAPALFAATALAAYLGTRAIPFAPFEILRSPVQILYFFLYDLLLMLPFFFAGVTVALILRSDPERAASLYAFDLVGAAAGSLLVFVSLPSLGAPRSVALAATLGCASAACLAGTHRPRGSILGLGILSIALTAAPRLLPDVRVDASKPLTRELNGGGRLAFSAWNALSRIDVVERQGIDPMILIDAAAMTPIAGPRTYRDGPPHEISAAAFVLRDQPAVVIIGSGGGVDVQQALGLGAREVTAVEINPTIIALVTGEYRERLGDAFANPRVKLVRDEGRSYIERSRGRADIIQITLIDTWAAGASGAYSLTENYLYTVDAFRSYVQHLSPDGILSITRWYMEVPRLVSLARAALESMRVESPSRHIAVLQQGIRTLLLVKRSQFTAEDMRRMREFAAAAKVQILHDPVEPDGKTFYDTFLASPDPRNLELESKTALEPVGDDNPFFFQMATWRSLSFGELRRFKAKSFLDPLAVPVGQLALLAALGLGILMSLGLLAIPILGKRVPRVRRGTWFVYFATLGFAYIIIEVVLMQRFALFLGHPTYSVTMVLFVLLLCSGLGSAWSGTRRGSTSELARPLLWLLPIALLGLAFAVPVLTRHLIGLPHPARLAVSFACIAPVAFGMGMPFPLGIRALAASDAAHVPWAWAANGCASVIGSVCAVLGAMLWNFSAMLVAAAVFYAFALAMLMRLKISLR